VKTYTGTSLWPVVSITHVRDGDTQEYEIDLGFKIRYVAVVRLARCNCPEMSTPEGQVAKTWAEAWLAGKDLVVSTTGRQDRYGRWIAEVIDKISAEHLSDALLAAGQAVPYP
jgi:micrococcal nuclease